MAFLISHFFFLIPHLSLAQPLQQWQAGEVVTDEDITAFGGLDKCFAAEPIPDDVWQRMQGKSYQENPYIGHDDLRHLRVLHWRLVTDASQRRLVADASQRRVVADASQRRNDDVPMEQCIGEMVCNKLIADSLVRLFRQLYDARYPIERMVLPDVYNADDETQMRHNNTSCFCYRAIAGSGKLSKHARGLAVDINPLYNPYYKDRPDGTRFVQPASATRYCNRKATFPYKIEKGDLCYRLFIDNGFTWGGAWRSCKDYQHFEF